MSIFIFTIMYLYMLPIPFCYCNFPSKEQCLSLIWFFNQVGFFKLYCSYIFFLKWHIIVSTFVSEFPSLRLRTNMHTSSSVSVQIQTALPPGNCLYCAHLRVRHILKVLWTSCSLATSHFPGYIWKQNFTPKLGFYDEKLIRKRRE